MPILITWPARQSSQLHQKNWGAALAERWRRWCLRWARHCQRKALRDLADNPHLLRDIGVTREQALEEAGKPFLAITDAYTHSI
ncbi:MAG: hypothetical protein JWP25_2806 [Bradyrhizobium sp.]|nr:hypothetical protein [Bradyrhizobium sp.]